MKKFICPIIYAAIYTLSAGLGMADDASPSTAVVAREIPMLAPNSPEQTVTVWVPATAARPAGERATGQNGTARVINLPAGSSINQSVTVWVADKYQKTAFYQAAGK